MDPVLSFAQRLDSVIPSDILEPDRDHLLFNITLVKFKARPSTLVDSYQSTDLLLTSPSFINFINHDSDLIIEQFTTEGPGEIWIYSKYFSDLFQEKDISQYDRDTIHKIRGIRLGFPCPGYFTEAYETPSLMTTIFLNNEPFYSYVCPSIQENGYQGVDMWFKFKPFADAIGFNLTLKFVIGFL
jgi:hypothetical protein